MTTYALDELNEASERIAKAESFMIDLMDQLEHNPRTLDEARERVRLLDRTCRKHSVSNTAELLAFAEEAEIVVSNQDRLEEEVESKRKQLKQVYIQMGETSWSMHQRRLDTIAFVQSAVESTLRELGMTFSLFRVETSECRAQPPANGLHVEEWAGCIPVHTNAMGVINEAGQQLEAEASETEWFKYQGVSSRCRKHAIPFVKQANRRLWNPGGVWCASYPFSSCCW